MTPRFAETEKWLRSCATAAFREVVSGISPSRFRRMIDPLTWTERIDGEEVQFEMILLEHDDKALHLAVSATLSTQTGRLLGMEGPSAVVDEIIVI